MDTCQRLLMRNEELVPVTPKAFDTLLVLVERSGKVVEKSELMNLLWPDTFVEEGNLTFNISTLRKALGRNSENGQYIETIPRRGYRFVASVREVKTKTADLTVAEDDRWQAAPGEQKTETKTENQWWHKKTLVSFMAPSGLAIALGIFWNWQMHEAPATVGRIGSIAVLPFRQLGTDKDQDYLGAGIADSLVIRLNKIQKLVVRPTSSVLKYSAMGQDPERVGRELKVDAVLDGRFQRM